jgi:hypothetical protein
MIEQVLDIGQIIVGRWLAIDIQGDSLAVGNVHGNFGAEYAVLENSVDALAYIVILVFRRHCFQGCQLAFEFIAFAKITRLAKSSKIFRKCFATL